jgi:endonuclease YncB( thermonuclease family)
MRRSRWIVLIGWAGVFLALTGIVYPAFSSSRQQAAAQQGDSATPSATSEDEAPVAPSVASPGASPVAQENIPSLPPEFIAGGRWRITIVYAARGTEIPELQLAQRSSRDWIVVIADVGNWSTKRATIKPEDFGISVAGDPNARGFNAEETQTAASRLSLEPLDVKKGVSIDQGTSKRLVLLFRIDNNVADPFLVYGDDTMPLASAFARGGNPTALPPAEALPQLTEASVSGVQDGSTLMLDDQPVRLAGVDAPNGNECFAGQASRRLERLAGDRVLVERNPPSDAAYVWVEDQSGLRTLINYNLIVSGTAAFQEGTDGPFSPWLQNGDRIAREGLAGLWASCTNQHGVARDQKPETTDLAIRSDGDTRPYAVWVAWSPLIVTKPDGSAWTFFSAEATEGGDKGNKHLFSSRFDPASGKWSTSRAMPGGNVQMGPSAVVDADGIVHLVYCDRAKDEPGVYSEIMYTHEDGQGGWVDPVPVAPEPTSGFQLSPSLTIDKLGVLHVIWQDQRAFAPEARDQSPSNADIFVSDLAPGGTWSKPVLANTHYVDAVGSRPHIVADGDRLIAVWSVYAASVGLNAAVRIDWSSRPLDDPLGWTAPQPLVVGRGESFGGRLLDMAADPTGGVVLVYGRQANDTFLFMRRLKPKSTEWGGDTLITFGDRGTFPSVTVSDQGVVYVVYNVGNAGAVDVGAVAIPYRSIQPGPEVVLTADQDNTQGRPTVATDVTGRPWIVFFSEPPDGTANDVRILRNADVPVTATP